MWLNEHDLDVTCIRLRPYKDELGSIFLDVQQIILNFCENTMCGSTILVCVVTQRCRAAILCRMR
jgi:hypothetical protein